MTRSASFSSDPRKQATLRAAVGLLLLTGLSLALVGWPRFGSAPRSAPRPEVPPAESSELLPSDLELGAETQPAAGACGWESLPLAYFAALRDDLAGAKDLFEAAASQRTPEERLALHAAEDQARAWLSTWREWETRSASAEQRIRSWLVAFAEAQEVYRASGIADEDGDGSGEYGTLREIAALTGEPWLLVRDAALVSGYLVRVVLPPCEFGPDARELHWEARALPIDVHLGPQAFTVDERGEVEAFHPPLAFEDAAAYDPFPNDPERDPR